MRPWKNLRPSRRTGRSTRKPSKFTSPVKITVIHYRKRSIDLDNGSIKAVLDGLVLCGVLEDDSSKQIQEITHRQIKAVEEKTIIEIEEI